MPTRRLREAHFVAIVIPADLVGLSGHHCCGHFANLLSGGFDAGLDKLLFNHIFQEDAGQFVECLIKGLLEFAFHSGLLLMRGSWRMPSRLFSVLIRSSNMYRLLP